MGAPLGGGRKDGRSGVGVAVQVPALGPLEAVERIVERHAVQAILERLTGSLEGAANLERDRTAVSGVNLDEEAAKLIQYQQAYQASAKMLQIAQSIFDSLLQTVSR